MDLQVPQTWYFEITLVTWCPEKTQQESRKSQPKMTCLDWNIICTTLNWSRLILSHILEKSTSRTAVFSFVSLYNVLDIDNNKTVLRYKIPNRSPLMQKFYPRRGDAFLYREVFFELIMIYKVLKEKALPPHGRPHFGIEGVLYPWHPILAPQFQCFMYPLGGPNTKPHFRWPWMSRDFFCPFCWGSFIETISGFGAWDHGGFLHFPYP